MGKNIDKRLWGVLGKQQTFYSPQKQVEGKTKTPLNANAFDSWDAKRSRFKRVDGYENAVQQGGVVPQDTTPAVSPTPSITPSPTPSFTPTQTITQTPSSTPIIDCYWNSNDDNWENDSTLWNDCINVPTPTPSPTNTNTPTNTETPTNTPTNTNTSTPTNTPTNTNTSTPTNTPTPSSTTPASGTTEARAFLNAVILSGGTGITSTVSAATETLFTSLVSNNLWDKLDAFYPIIGGNAQGCCIEAKSLSTYNLIFNGGWTFNSSGATPNGTNAYADTNFTDNLLTNNNNHISIYLRSDVNAFQADMGVQDTAGSGTGTNILPRLTDLQYIRNQDGTGNNGASTDSRGFWVANRTISTTKEGYRNGIIVVNQASTSTSLRNIKHYIGALNDGGAQYYSTREVCFASLGKGFTSGETATLSSIINTFQTSLNRNTY